MELFEAIKKRYSCRDYQDKPIEQDKLDRIMEAARLAPSAKNLQDWRFVIATDKAIIQQLAKAANNQSFIAKAGVVIVACTNSDYAMRCGQSIGPIDISIALEHIALQATAEEMASCWIGSFFPEEVRPILGIPDEIEIIELMTIGYPASEEKHTKREPIEKIVCYNGWGF